MARGADNYSGAGNLNVLRSLTKYTDNIDETETFPSHAQARRMRVAFEEGKLYYDAVTEIMNELKPNQVEKLKIPMDDIRKYVPKSMTPAEKQAYLLKLVKQNYERQHNRDAR